jgi:hypothetical protein
MADIRIFTSISNPTIEAFVGTQEMMTDTWNVFLWPQYCRSYAADAPYSKHYFLILVSTAAPYTWLQAFNCSSTPVAKKALGHVCELCRAPVSGFGHEMVWNVL